MDLWKVKVCHNSWAGGWLFTLLGREEVFSNKRNGFPGFFLLLFDLCELFAQRERNIFLFFCLVVHLTHTKDVLNPIIRLNDNRV